MLPSNKLTTHIYQFPDSKKLWHSDEKKTESLGCSACAFRVDCGGLRVDAKVYDCDSFCRCADRAKCDNVCPNNIDHYVARVQEVGGLNLLGIPPSQRLPKPVFPRSVPLIYHGAKRDAPLELPVAALSLYKLIDRHTGDVKFETRKALTDYFGLARNTELILSGTHTDPSLERWWALDCRGRVIEKLASMDIKMVTAPNYSLFDDVPRTDNLYNMKRIALTSLEFLQHGIPTALHVNSRTERDYERWGEFLIEHDEFDFLTFEFGTGAGRKSRIQWHADQLVILAERVNRPLTLVIRGGLSALPILNRAFHGVMFIDTASFVKAQKRQIGNFDGTKLGWTQKLTSPGEPIDSLICQNASSMAKWINHLADAA